MERRGIGAFFRYLGIHTFIATHGDSLEITRRLPRYVSRCFREEQ
jgi:hypothetical protein